MWVQQHGTGADGEQSVPADQPLSESANCVKPARGEEQHPVCKTAAVRSRRARHRHQHAQPAADPTLACTV